MHHIALLLTLRLIEEEQDSFPMEAQALACAIKRLLQQETVHRQTVAITAAVLGKEEENTRIRLSLSGNDVTSVIASLHELSARSPLRLCQQRYEVASIELAHPIWSRVNSWADILAPSAARIMHFSFATPLITKEPANQMSRDALPFPEPIPLFSSVIDSWSGLGGPGLPADTRQLVQAADCVCRPRRTFLHWLYGLDRVRVPSIRPSLSCLVDLPGSPGILYRSRLSYGTGHGSHQCPLEIVRGAYAVVRCQNRF